MKIKITLLLICCFVLSLLAADSVRLQEQRLTEPGEERLNARQPPDQVMDAIGVRPGMVIGEVGAGRGRYTVLLAVRVGETGKIFANDIDREAPAYLENRCRKNGITNVETVLGEVRDPKFPENSLDIAFMISTYHHLEDPVALLRNIVPALKPEGRLVIVEYDPEKPGVSHDSSTSKEEMRAVVESAGYELIRIEEFLPRDNIYIMRRK